MRSMSAARCSEVTMTRRSLATGCWRASRLKIRVSRPSRRRSISGSSEMTCSAFARSPSSSAEVARRMATSLMRVIVTSVVPIESSSSWYRSRMMAPRFPVLAPLV